MIDRTNCPMRHLNGNCLPVGGFCTAINDEICDSLKQAYECGMQNQQKEFVKPSTKIKENFRLELITVDVCGNCRHELKRYPKWNFCPECGKAVKWDE